MALFRQTDILDCFFCDLNKQQMVLFFWWGQPDSQTFRIFWKMVFERSFKRCNGFSKLQSLQRFILEPVFTGNSHKILVQGCATAPSIFCKVLATSQGTDHICVWAPLTSLKWKKAMSDSSVHQSGLHDMNQNPMVAQIWLNPTYSNSTGFFSSPKLYLRVLLN